MNKKNQKLFIIVGVLLLFGGVSLAYFVSKILTNGNGGNTSVTTAVIKGATVNVEGVLSFEDLDILPGHKSISSIKVTATGNNELIPYNLIWQGTNTLTTPLNFTIYKTSEKIEVKATCEDKSKMIGASKAIYEECNISNIDKLGAEIATGVINKNDLKVTLVKDEFITAKTNSDIWYYYIILEYPNLDEPQNYDLEGVIEGEVTVEESSVKPDINIIAAYVVQEDGTYKEVEDIPQSGYVLNSEKSTCSNGTIPSWDNDKKGLFVLNLTKSGTSCYLYFDKYVSPTAEMTLAKLGITEVKDQTSTVPDFSKTATTDEGIFKTDDPMYGENAKTYYWRGATTSNHVIFADKCWRIVRINGDGSIRLIYNGTTNDGTTCNNNPSDSVPILNQAYNIGYNNPVFVGYTYEIGVQRPSEIGAYSNARRELEKWFNSNIKRTNVEKIAIGKFCNDRNVKNGQTWGPTVGQGTSFQYASYARLLDAKTPTLACDTEDVYTLKVGLIQADEVSMAGGKVDTSNNSYYLYNSIYAYWTMSPLSWAGSYSDGSAYVFDVRCDGSFSADLVHQSSGLLGLRPVINLRSDVTFNSGSDGTQNNPYIVQ